MPNDIVKKAQENIKTKQYCDTKISLSTKVSKDTGLLTSGF